MKRVISLILCTVILFVGISFLVPVRFFAASYAWPVDTGYGITNGFYAYSGHNGVDFAVPLGTPVYAVANGTVTTAMDRGCLGSHRSGGSPQCPYGGSCAAWNNNGNNGSFGNYIYITNDDGTVSRYCHLSTGFSTRSGQRVSQGECIGYSGAAGNTTGPHLHFELRSGGTALNPADYLTRINVNPTPPTPETNNPIGYLDYVSSDAPGEIHLHGWTFDWDDVNAEILLHVYVNDSHYATIKANQNRSDVNAVYPGVGDNHGFDATLIVNKSGNLNIKVYAINVGSGTNVLVENGEKAVTVNADPSTPKRIKTCTLDGHEYRLYACNTTWENAKKICEEKGGYLATITSNREQKLLYSFLSEYSPSNFFLGGTSKTGSWEWVTGEPFSYTAWAENQPDCSGNAEFYLGSYKHSSTNDNLKFWNDFTNDYSGITGFVYESGNLEEDVATPSDNPPTVSYSGYIDDSWTDIVVNGEIIGSEDLNRFKAIKIGLTNCTGGIKYAGHFSGTGWGEYVQDNDICGSTTNEYSSLEAIKMELFGDVASNYNLFYRAYVRDKGWLGWAENGEAAGSTGGALPITAIQIMMVPQVRCVAHVEDKGWMNRVKDKEICGTEGEKLQLEALKIYLKDTAYGNISYRTHIADLGWGNYVYNDKPSGTTSLSLQAEAFSIKLDSKADEMFDVMYKAHVQEAGWMDWVRNGETAGTTGQKMRLEAFKVMIVPKGYTGADSCKEYSTEQFTVTFDPMGGECSVNSKQVVYCGFYKDMPVPTKSGFIFDGWYDSKDYTNLFLASSTVETKADITLYAKWITTPTYTAGDINGDKAINMKDLVLLQQYLNHWDVTINVDAADVNKDGNINMKDIVLLQQYLNNWDVNLG